MPSHPPSATGRANTPVPFPPTHPHPPGPLPLPTPRGRGSLPPLTGPADAATRGRSTCLARSRHGTSRFSRTRSKCGIGRFYRTLRSLYDTTAQRHSSQSHGWSTPQGPCQGKPPPCHGPCHDVAIATSWPRDCPVYFKRNASLFYKEICILIFSFPLLFVKGERKKV